MITEIERKLPSGYGVLVMLFLAQCATIYAFAQGLMGQRPAAIIAATIAIIIVAIMWAGFLMVHPNEAKVLQLFGKYVGTAHEPGLRWANPFYQKSKVSTRVRNFESGQLKVNDSRGVLCRAALPRGGTDYPPRLLCGSRR